MTRSCATLVALAAALLPAADPAPTRPPAPWQDAATENLPGLKVTLSAPVLVARSKDYLWFPTLFRRPGADLLAMMTNYPDVHTDPATSRVCWSGDGGRTWTEPKDALYADAAVLLPGGDLVLLPYYLRPRKDGLGAPYQRVARGTRELVVAKDGLTITGWPRPDQPNDAKLGLAGFVFNGQAVTTRDGAYLATLYGTYRGDKRYTLVLAESRDGTHWNLRSTVAGADCKLEGKEGPCEAALARLKDGRLMCVFRLAGGVPYGQSWSEDEGKTWADPVAMKGPFSVQPSLAVLRDGTVILSGGRPGLFAWFNLDGTGKGWERVDLRAHHNRCHPKEVIGAAERTSSYTEVVALDDTHLLVIYDRIPHGWRPIPKDSAETNSVWVVRLTLGRRP